MLMRDRLKYEMRYLGTVVFMLFCILVFALASGLIMAGVVHGLTVVFGMTPTQSWLSMLGAMLLTVVVILYRDLKRENFFRRLDGG